MRDDNGEQVEGVAAAIEAGRQLGDLKGRVDAVSSHDGKARIAFVLRDASQSIHPLTDLQKAADRLAGNPRRFTGTATHHEQQSFVDHVNRFKDGDSVIWADADAVRLTAVLDYHQGGVEGLPRWCEHRSVYTCPLSDEWRAWVDRDGKLVRQEDFADFLEEHAPEIYDKAEGMAKALDLIELATNLRIFTKGTCTRQFDKRTGAEELVNKTELSEQSTKIPRAFQILIPIFVGGELHAIECRLRLRVKEGVAFLGFEMHRRREHLRAAFSDVREKVREATALPVFAGAPEEAP